MLAGDVGREDRKGSVSAGKKCFGEGADGVGVETPCLVNCTGLAVQEVRTFWDLGAFGGEDGACRNVELGGRFLRALDQKDYSDISIDDLTYTEQRLTFLKCWLKYIINGGEVLESRRGHATHKSSHGNITLVSLEASMQAESSLDGRRNEVGNVFHEDGSS